MASSDAQRAYRVFKPVVRRPSDREMLAQTGHDLQHGDALANLGQEQESRR